MRHEGQQVCSTPRNCFYFKHWSVKSHCSTERYPKQFWYWLKPRRRWSRTSSVHLCIHSSLHPGGCLPEEPDTWVCAYSASIYSSIHAAFYLSTHPSIYPTIHPSRQLTVHSMCIHYIHSSIHPSMSLINNSPVGIYYALNLSTH